MKIGIIALLQNLDPAYSVATVVLSHIRMLKKQGHTPVLLTSSDSSITEDRAGCEVRSVIPVWKLYDYPQVSDIREEDRPRVEEVKNAILENTKDCLILVEHDCIMQGWFAIHGLAMNYIPNIKHVIHSRVGGQPIKKLPDNHKVLVLNAECIRETESAYNIPGRVTAIPNPMDICEYFEMDELTKTWVRNWNLLDFDYIFTYPFSATRRDAKGFDFFALFTKYMNNRGYKTAGIFLMAHGNEMPPVNWDTCHFSNLMYPDHNMGVSRKVVRDFFLLSDGFIFPSKKELSPLVHLEAGLAKNTVILNECLNIHGLSEDLSDLTNKNFELVMRTFLQKSEGLNEFRRIRKGFNEQIIGKRLCDWLLEAA